MAKPAKDIQEQIKLLQDRGMKFRNIADAPHFLANISYYRLKGYWWEMQADKVQHRFLLNSYFEDVLDLYNFDRHFRLIAFNAIERIEIALRTNLIYHLSMAYGPQWYTKTQHFTKYKHHLVFKSKIFRDLCNSSEEFITKHYDNHTTENPEAWKALEIVTLGTLSKIYQN